MNLMEELSKNIIRKLVAPERPTQRTRMRRMRIQPRWSVIILSMNSYVSASHKLYAMSANSHQIQQIPKPTVVTMCLTDGHEECTGTYVDTTNSFKIQCKCRCHANGSIK